MTVVEGLIAYLKQCPSIGEISRVGIERTDEGTSYAVAPSGSTITKRYRDGSAVVESDYVLYLADNADDDEQRLENNQFLEAVFDWVLAQTAKQNFPSIGENRTVRKLLASNGMPFRTEENGDTVYQMQFKIIYIQKGER